MKQLLKLRQVTKAQQSREGLIGKHYKDSIAGVVTDVVVAEFTGGDGGFAWDRRV
jgi:hypothetical protein